MNNGHRTNLKFNIYIEIGQEIGKEERTVDFFVNIEELNEILKKTVYSNISTDDIYELECNMKKYLHGLYIKNFKSNLLSINCIYSYLNLVELENKDIISIIEAVRYGIDKEKLLKKLIN